MIILSRCCFRLSCSFPPMILSHLIWQLSLCHCRFITHEGVPLEPDLSISSLCGLLLPLLLVTTWSSFHQNEATECDLWSAGVRSTNEPDRQRHQIILPRCLIRRRWWKIYRKNDSRLDCTERKSVSFTAVDAKRPPNCSVIKAGGIVMPVWNSYTEIGSQEEL